MLQRGARNAEAPERLSGPSAASRRYADWDSALLELHGSRSGRFTLELWRFYEAWRVPGQPGPESTSELGEAKETPGDASFRAPGQPRASVLHREETRIACAGTFEVREVPALRLAGLQRAGLNQSYVEQPDLQISGLPTWWSEDGRYFIYFAEEYRHWKVNALRAGGGDGMRAVRPGGRRSGRGFAHSGAVEALISERQVLQTRAREALWRAEGWFQVHAGDWEPVQPQVSVSRAWALDLSASNVSSEELLVHGENSSSERRSSGPCHLHGVRSAAATNGQALLFVPTLPDDLEGSRASEEVLATEDEGQEQDDEAGAGTSGDPDVLLLEPLPEAKL